MSMVRARWAAVGAALAVTCGAGGLVAVQAAGSATPSTYTAIDPCRLLDTRPRTAVGAHAGAFGATEIFPLTVTGTHGRCAGIPIGVSAVALNVTAIGASELTYLTFWSSGDLPDSSSLNPAPGEPPTPNAVTTKVDDDGIFHVYNDAGSVHVLIDVVGYYTEQAVDGAEPRPVAAYAHASGGIALQPTPQPVLSLATDGGPLVTTGNARVVVNASVTVVDGGLTGDSTQTNCQLELSTNGGTFRSIGVLHGIETRGNDDHDEVGSLSLTAGADVTAGSHDVRLSCSYDSFGGFTVAYPSMTATAIPTS